MSVIPAQAGIQRFRNSPWIPARAGTTNTAAFAGMTNTAACAGMTACYQQSTDVDLTVNQPHQRQTATRMDFDHKLAMLRGVKLGCHLPQATNRRAALLADGSTVFESLKPGDSLATSIFEDVRTGDALATGVMELTAVSRS